MLAKDELVRELILLLLRSLKSRKEGLDLYIEFAQSKQKGTQRKHLHQLQILVGRQLLWHNTKLVSIQVPKAEK